MVVLLNALLFAAAPPRAQAKGELVVSSRALRFEDVVVGQSQIIKITLKNSGNSAIILSGHSLNGVGFSMSGIVYPKTLDAGAEIPLSIRFAPSKAGNVSGTAQLFTKDGNGTVEITLKGAGVAKEAAGYLSATPLHVQFQNVPVGTHYTQSIKLTNTGSVRLTISGVKTTGNGFSVSGLATPLSIAGGSSEQLTVGFLPESVGSSSGSILLTSSASDSHMTIVLSGTAVGSSRVLEVSPASVAFGNVLVNGSATQQFTLKNEGNSNLNISGDSIHGTGLSVTGVTAETLAPGQTAVVTTEFAPKTAGTTTGGIAILSNASNGGSITVPVTGTGVVATRVVKLQWQPSRSTGVIGYYVYRSTVSGGPYTKVVSAPNAGTSYSDSNVISGAEYYYVVTAVGADGNESTYSAQVAVSVP
ncbi:MAG: choice-of-anchor D domain-containing protein [Candidatus Acidiferrum sp.]